MLTLPKAALIVALCVIGALGAETVVPLVVTGDGVCLRARADGESEVVWQVSSGTVLQGVGDGSNWVEVLTPGEVSVWMSADLVSNGVVRVSKAHVRAGPGMNYPAVGSAQRNDRVDVRGESHGWIKIGPPASCRLWISRSYVKPLPEKKPVVVRQVPPSAQVIPAPAPLPAAVPVRPASVDVPRTSHTASSGPSKATAAPPPSPAVPSQAAVSTVSSQAVVKATTDVTERNGTNQPSVVLPAALRKYEVEPDVGQGRQALYRGTMDKCNWLLRKPAKYRLVTRHPRQGIVTLCYVSGDPVLLTTLEGKRVALSGREYRLKGVERPVVVYESVVEDAANLTGAGIDPIIP